MTMGWIILGLIFLVVTIWSLKGTTIAEYYSKNRIDEHHVPIWVLFLAFLIYCIPGAGSIVFIAYLAGFFILANRKPHNGYEYWIIELSPKNTLHRILGCIATILTKTI